MHLQLLRSLAIPMLALSGLWGHHLPTANHTVTAHSTTNFSDTDDYGFDYWDIHPAVAFLTPDGIVFTEPLSYGSIQVAASDPDRGTWDGAGIAGVDMLVTNAFTGEAVAWRTEYWSTYDFGPNLTDGTYIFTATARSDRRAGGSSTTTSITVTIATASTAPAAPTYVPSVAAPPVLPPAPPALPTATAIARPIAPPPTPIPTATAIPPAPTPIPTAPAIPRLIPTATAIPLPQPIPAPPTTDGTNLSFAALNQLRANLGLNQLSLNPTMSTFALDWSQEMTRTGFRHSNGPYGENIAWYGDPNLTADQAAQWAHDAWVNSPGHYANMTSPNYTEMGIGIYRDSTGWWATHVFR